MLSELTDKEYLEIQVGIFKSVPAKCLCCRIGTKRLYTKSHTIYFGPLFVCDFAYRHPTAVSYCKKKNHEQQRNKQQRHEQQQPPDTSGARVTATTNASSVSTADASVAVTVVCLLLVLLTLALVNERQ